MTFATVGVHLVFALIGLHWPRDINSRELLRSPEAADGLRSPDCRQASARRHLHGQEAGCSSSQIALSRLETATFPDATLPM